MDQMSPNRAAHPGFILRAELDKRGWNQSDLTFVLGCNPKVVNEIVNEKRGISPAMSKALGEALGFAPEFFADLQNSFDLAIAHNPDRSVSLRARMAKNFPIREMVRRGWLREGKAEDLGHQLASFFGVGEVGEIPSLAHSAKKENYGSGDTPGPQLAWLFRVRQIAASVATPPYSERRLKEAVEKMRELRIAPEEARKVPRLLAECGVRFVIVEALPGSRIDGVCFWLNSNSPVIGMTMRFDRIDNFWFVLRHEIEHVLRGHGSGTTEGMIDIELRGEQSDTGVVLPEEERVANAAASDFCVPAEKMESFFLRKSPFFYEKDIVAFAKVNNVHPGLPVGQVQHRLKRYEYLKKYQERSGNLYSQEPLLMAGDKQQ